MKNLPVCVVGAGHWGKNHIKTLHELGSLGGIVDSDLKRLDFFSKKFPNLLTYKNIDEALKQNKMAGYIVATPAETHYRITKKIISFSKHVLVEKPLTLNVKDAETLVSLANTQNVNLMVGHLLLFHPAIMKIKDLINSGKIGDLRYIYSNRLNLGKVRSHENVFWSLAPHDISIFQYIIDSFPKTINVNGSVIIQKKIHDSAIATFEYPKNIKGHIFVSWLHPFKEHRLVIIGTEGMLSFEDSIEGSPLKFYNKKYKIKNNYPEKIDGDIELIKYDKTSPLHQQLNYFINHLNGKKLIMANSKHALDVIKILVSASKSLKRKLSKI